MHSGLLAMLLATSACAHTPAPDAAPRPADVETIDGIMRAFYEVVNFDAGAPRQWSRDRTLYSPWIRFVSIGRVVDGRPRIDVWSHQELVDQTDALGAQGFHERELFREQRQYGNTAQVRSSYVGWVGTDESAAFRGVNNIDLYFDGARWWIASVMWQSEDAAHPIPPELLPPDR